MASWIKQSWGGINLEHVVRWSVRDGGARVVVYFDAPVGTDTLTLPGAGDDPANYYLIHVDGEDAAAFLAAVSGG